MIKRLFIMCVSLVWTVALVAQNISVVDSNGNTQLYRTLTDAILKASEGSVVYLPGGGFPLNDSVKITKRLTIIGIGHYVKSGNADGVTTISGNLWFNDGSDGSAVLGCYITGTVVIGDGNTSVNDILVRCCNVGSVSVRSSSCYGINVNQNYIRSSSLFGNSSSNITNNIIHSIANVDGGSVLNNIIISYYKYYSYYSNGNTNPQDRYGMIVASNSLISNNIFIGSGKNSRDGSYVLLNGSNNIVSHNMTAEALGDSCINIKSGSSTVTWDSVFVKYNNAYITPVSDFHFKDNFKKYEKQVGIYGGTDFNDKQIAPVPYIISKYVDEQTDAQGKLNIRIRVKASE